MAPQMMESDVSLNEGPMLFASILAVIRVSLTYILMLLLMIMGRNRGWSGRKVVLWSLLGTYLLEPVDSIPGRIVYGVSYAKTDTYQRVDKVTDMVVYGIILAGYFMYGDTDATFTGLLVATYIWRLIGTVIYLFTSNKGMLLVVFPNLFVEPMIVLATLSEYTDVSINLRFVLTVIAIMVKVAYEYFHHEIWSSMIW